MLVDKVMRKVLFEKVGEKEQNYTKDNENC